LGVNLFFIACAYSVHEFQINEGLDSHLGPEAAYPLVPTRN